MQMCSKSSKADADELLVPRRRLHPGSSLMVRRGRSKTVRANQKSRPLAEVLGSHAVVTDRFTPPAGQNQLISSAASPRSCSLAQREQCGQDSAQLDQAFFFYGRLTVVMKEDSSCEPLQLGLGKGRQNKQTFSLHADLPLSSSPQVLAFKLEFCPTFKAAKTRENKPQPPAARLQQYSGDVTRGQVDSVAASRNFLPFLSKNSLAFFFFFPPPNSLKEQLVQIRSQLHEHDGKLLRVTKQGS